MDHHEINLSSFAFLDNMLVFLHSRKVCERYSELRIHTFNTEPGISFQNQFHKLDMNFCGCLLPVIKGHPGIDGHSERPSVVRSALLQKAFYHVPVNYLARPRTEPGTSDASGQWPQRYPGSLPESAWQQYGRYAPDCSAAFPQRSRVQSH